MTEPLGAPASVVGPVTLREVARLAGPAMAGAVLHNAFRPLDQYFVGGLGKEAQGALGAVTFVMILAYGCFLLVAAGAGPLIARATGAGDAEARRRVVGASLTACAAMSIGFVLVGLVLTDDIVALLGLSGPTAEHARHYLRAIALTGAGLVFAPTVDAGFQAMGNTSTPMVLQLATLLANAVLTPLLIYWAGLGTAGAALGSTLAQTASMLVGGVLLWRAVGLRRSHLWPSAVIGRVVRLGAPIAATTAMYALVYWALLATSISPLGPSVNAGLGVGFGVLEAVAWPVYLGLSVAVASIVGRRLGAGQPDEAWRAVRMLVGPSLGLGVLGGLLFTWIGPWVVHAFAADADAAREGTRYGLILAWSQPFVALEVFAEGVLAGAGDTGKVLWGTVPFNVLRVPLAWALSAPLGFGAAGVWWAINATSMMKAAAKSALVWQGAWARLDPLRDD